MKILGLLAFIVLLIGFLCALKTSEYDNEHRDHYD